MKQLWEKDQRLPDFTCRCFYFEKPSSLGFSAGETALCVFLLLPVHYTGQNELSLLSTVTGPGSPVCVTYIPAEKTKPKLGNKTISVLGPENTQTHSISGKLWELNGQKGRKKSQKAPLSSHCKLKFAVDILICTSWTQRFRLFIQSKVQEVGLVYLLEPRHPFWVVWERSPPPTPPQLFCMQHGDVYKVSPALERLHTAPVKPQERASWKLLVNRTSGNWQLPPPHPPHASPVCECNFPYLRLYTSQ